jgi:hypothetical protein
MRARPPRIGSPAFARVMCVMNLNGASGCVAGWIPISWPPVTTRTFQGESCGCPPVPVGPAGISWPSVRSEAHEQLLPGNPVEHEPSRVAPFEALRNPPWRSGPGIAPLSVPDDLGRGETLTERVEHLEDGVLQVDAAFEQDLAHEGGVGLILGIAGGGLDFDIQLRHRHFARMQHALVKLVLFLHPLGELEIEPRVAVFGLAQNHHDFIGREAERGIDNRIDIADAGECRRRLLFLEQFELDRPAVLIE